MTLTAAVCQIYSELLSHSAKKECALCVYACVYNWSNCSYHVPSSLFSLKEQLLWCLPSSDCLLCLCDLMRAKQSLSL